MSYSPSRKSPTLNWKLKLLLVAYRQAVVGLTTVKLAKLFFSAMLSAASAILGT